MTRGGRRQDRGALLLATALMSCFGGPPPVGGSTDASSGSSSSGTTSSSTTAMNPDSSGGVSQTPACRDYLECVEQADEQMLPEAEAEYGPDGTCWADATTAEQCNATCELETDELCLSMGSGGGTGDEPLLCSLEALAAGAPSPVEAGEGAEMLPLEIGDLLERNCGCHYVDSARLDPRVPAYNGDLSLATWSDFHTSFMGQLTHLRVRQRSIVELSMPPPFFCDPLEFGSLGADDYAILSAWLDAGAPDAARWTGS